MTDFCSNSDLDSKIITCMIRRFSTKESLDYLNTNGYELKERTYFDRKKELKKFKKERLTNLVDDFLWKHFELIYTMESIQKNLWKDLEETTDGILRLKIHHEIKENQLFISKCYDATLQVTDRQIESYRAVEISDRLTHAGHLKFVEQNTKDRLKNKLDSLEEKLNEPFKDPMALPVPEMEDAKEKEIIRKEIEKVKSELEKLNSRDDTS